MREIIAGQRKLKSVTMGIRESTHSSLDRFVDIIHQNIYMNCLENTIHNQWMMFQDIFFRFLDESIPYEKNRSQ